jgi:hypothetical protein
MPSPALQQNVGNLEITRFVFHFLSHRTEFAAYRNMELRVGFKIRDY